jgi:hypothetical protein
MSSTARAPRQSPQFLGISLLACVACATVGACATNYMSTSPRPATAGGLRAEITNVEGPLRKLTVQLETSVPQRIESMSIGSMTQAPCSATPLEAIADRDSRTAIDLPRDLDGAAVVTVEPAHTAVVGAGRTLDIKTAALEGDSACLRLPLTATHGDLLWRSPTPAWGMAASLRWDVPASSLAGVGMGGMAEMRGVRPWGPVRLVGGFDFGWAGCRGPCPELGFVDADDEDGESRLVGLYYRVGLVLGAETRVRLGRAGRWALEAGLGASADVALLSAPADFRGPRNLWLLGPVATLRLLFPDRHPLPGFTPAVEGMIHGVELTARHLTALGRSGESGWMFSLGWTFGGTL